MPNGHVKGFDTRNDESAKWQLTDNIPLRDVIRTFMAARCKKYGPKSRPATIKAHPDLFRCVFAPLRETFFCFSLNVASIDTRRRFFSSRITMANPARTIWSRTAFFILSQN